jgi:hypothetical protein
MTQMSFSSIEIPDPISEVDENIIISIPVLEEVSKQDSDMKKIKIWKPERTLI